MRLFIALSLNDAEQDIKLLQSRLPASVSKNKHVHLTLKFLSDVPADKLELIKKKLSDVEFDSFEFKLSKLGFFPSEDNMRVLWVGTQPQENIIALQKQIDSALSPLFLADKAFKPHITLARVKNVNAKNDVKKFISKIKIPEINIKVSEFQLIQSILGKESEYKVLQVFPAKNSV